MRRILRLLICLLPISAAGAADRPNVVVIYADDVGFGDLGCYGAETVPTPNCDALAAAGVRLTSGYATSATCTPSRFSLLTGEYAWREPGRGILPPNGASLIKPGVPTVASALRDAGYRTAVIGKWHLGLGDGPKPDWSGEIKPGPLEIGFDECFLLPTTNDRVPCVYLRDHRIVGLDPEDPVDVFYQNPDGQPTGKTHRDTLRMDWSHGHNDSIVNGIGRIGFMTGGHAIRWVDEDMADVFVEETRAFLERSHEEPFFLFYAAHEIHVPRAPHPRFAGATPHGARGDAIAELDWTVGEIVKELERLGVADNTIVMITSDNGPVLDDGYKDDAVEKLGDHKPGGPYRGGKYSRFEAGTRVPWIVSWPGRIEPTVSDEPVSQVDLFASLMAMLGVATPEGAAPDSLDVSAALLGEGASAREAVIEHNGFGAALAIRRGRWKYIEPNRGARMNRNTQTELANRAAPQLYDLEADPGERHNVFDANPTIGRQLQEELARVKGDASH